MMQYTQDYDEKMPRAWSSSTGGGFPGDYKWMDTLVPYIKSDQLFTCPSASGDNHLYVQRNGTRFGSYAYNSVYWNNANGSANQGPGNNSQSLSELQSPATTILVGDGNGSFQVAWENKADDPETPRFAGATQFMADTGLDENHQTEGAWIQRHLETINFLYTDGHVKSGKMNSFLQKSTTGSDFMRFFTPADD